MKLSKTCSRKIEKEPSIKVNSMTPTIELKNIVRIEGQSNYSLIHTNGGSIICTKSLKFFEENIKDPRFIRPHKSHIVNTDYIKDYSKNAGNFKLSLKNGTSVDVARRRNKDILSVIL
ncbi:MAG: two-component system LytT family response regulator [Spirosomataceae bacterium]|jgi:two-component system LytT family response regulator